MALMVASNDPVSWRGSECSATCTPAASATVKQASIAAGVDPQSSCSLKPDAPQCNCSHNASALTVLPLPSSAKFTGQQSSDSSIRARCHSPGVTVVDLVTSAGPVPPPMIVVVPAPSASVMICGQNRCP